MGHGVVMGGTMYVPITDSSLPTESVWIGSGGSFTETQLPIPPPDIGVTPNAGGNMLDWACAAAPSGWLPQYIRKQR